MAVLKDSGKRRKFDSGAERDITAGKGRCDLLPLDMVGSLLSDDVVRHLDVFMRSSGEAFYSLGRAIDSFCIQRGWDLITAMLEVSIHFEDGATKYGENNWRKGMPLHCYIDSAVRHYLKWCRGDQDEPHDRAVIWNLLCAAWTVRNKPDLIDITYEGE